MEQATLYIDSGFLEEGRNVIAIICCPSYNFVCGFGRVYTVKYYYSIWLGSRAVLTFSHPEALH